MTLQDSTPRWRQPGMRAASRPCGRWTRWKAGPQPGLANATYFLTKLRILPKLWGGPPGPRGSPLDPLFANEITIIHTAASRRGRRLRTGGVRPTINADCAVLGKVCGIGQDWLPHFAQLVPALS